MPQLVTSTFSSQIFWLIVGFSLIYCFIAKVLSSKIEKIFSNRDCYISKQLKTADQLEKDSSSLEHDSLAAFKRAQLGFAENESRLVSDLKKSSLEKENSLRGSFSIRFKKESELLVKSSEKVFDSMSGKIDGMVEIAFNSISVRKS